MDFLEHEMPILSALDRVRRQIALPPARAAGLLKSRISDGSAAHLGDIALFQKHEAPGHGQQRRDIRGREVFVYAQTDHRRAALARHHDALRIRLREHRERIGAAQFSYCLLHGPQQAARGCQMMMNAVRNHLGIGFRVESIAQSRQFNAQGLVIFDDAVVHDGDAALRDMRVRVFRGGHAVSGPASVGDADRSVQRLGIERVLEDLTLPTERRRAIRP